MSSSFRTKLITFDGRGTMFQLSASVGHFYGKAAELYGAKLRPAYEHELSAAFEKSWKVLAKEHPNFGATSGITSQMWWQLMVERTLRNGSVDQRAISDAAIKLVAAHLFKQFSTRNCWQVKGNAMAGLTALKARHPQLKLGVISNTDERLDSILLQLGLRHFFDFAIDSCSAKVEKPEKAIFDLALSNAQLSDPQEAVHIGDNFELDYVAARAAGWKSLLIADDVNKFLEKLPPRHVIGSLSEIESKLD